MFSWQHLSSSNCGNAWSKVCWGLFEMILILILRQAFHLCTSSVEYGGFVVLKRRPQVPFPRVNEGHEMTTWNSLRLFSCLLNTLSKGLYASRRSLPFEAVSCGFCDSWRPSCLSSLQRAQLLTCSLGLKEIWTEYLGQWLERQGGTGEEIVFCWKPQRLYVGLCRLNCLESTRIMEFRVVSCHEAELALLWYDPVITLRLYLKHVVVTLF